VSGHVNFSGLLIKKFAIEAHANIHTGSIGNSAKQQQLKVDR